MSHFAVVCKKLPLDLKDEYDNINLPFCEEMESAGETGRRGYHTRLIQYILLCDTYTTSKKNSNDHDGMTGNASGYKSLSLCMKSFT